MSGTSPRDSSVTTNAARIVGILLWPPEIAPWLVPPDKRASIIILDVDIDIASPGELAIHLNVAFNPISVATGIAQRKRFYVGCTGAEITLSAEDGDIKDWTHGAALDVSYANSRKGTRKAALVLAPKLAAKSADSESSVEPGTIKREQGEEVSYSASFSSQERTLEAVYLHNTVRWQILLPRGEKAVRDFLIGNLYLSATCNWLGAVKRGAISVCPADVRFFDEQRRPIPDRNSLFMLYHLWRNKIRLRNRDGFEVRYEEVAL